MTSFEDPLYQRLVDLVTKIVTETDNHEVIFVRVNEVIERGHRNLQSFKEEYLGKVFKEVSRGTTVSIELIEDIVLDRIKYLPQSYRSNNRRCDNP